MGDVLRCLELRSQGRTREHKYLKSHKSVLHILEDAAATPSHNQPCEFSGEPRATFLMDFSISKLRVASTHGDHTVRVSDVRTGKCTHILTGHPRTPWCLAFSPVSDDILASGCLAGEIRIWDLMGGGSESLRNPCRGQVVTSLAFHPGGKVLVFATLNYIYFWDWSKDTPFAFTKTTHESERIRWLRFDPFGHYLYTGIGNLTSFHRDVIGAEMQVSSGMDDGGESSDTPEERVSQHLLNRARYQRLLERFMAFQQDRTRQREASDIPGPPEASDGLRSTRRLFDQAVNLCQRSREIFQRLAPSATRQRMHGTDTDFRERNNLSQRQGPDQSPYPSQTAGSEGLDDNRLGRRTLDSDWLFRGRQDELQSRQRWGRYEPTFFTRSDNGSSRDDLVDRGSLNYSMPLRQFRHRGQSLDPYPRTSLQPPSLTESAGPSGVSCLVSDTPAHVGQALREGNAASESLDTNEFEIIPVNRTERSRYGISRNRHALPVSRNETSHRPCFIQQREELQALLSRYVNRSGDESSASSEAAAVAPPQTSLACVSSAASTGDCNETDVKSSTTQPLLAEAASARSLPEQQIVAREVGSTDCYSAVSSSVNHSCASFSPLNRAHNSVSCSAHTTSSHEGTSGMLDTVENNKPPSAGPEESLDVPVIPETVKQNESSLFRVYRCDVNPANETAGSSTNATAQSSLHSECTEATAVREEETSEHSSTSEDKSEKPIIPECHFSCFRRMTSLNNTDHDSSQSLLNDVNDNWVDGCTRSNSVPLSQEGSSLATNTLECDHSCSAHGATSRTSGRENDNLLPDGEVASRQESSSELGSARLRRYTTTLRRSIRNEQSPYQDEFWKRRHTSVSSNLQPASHEGTLRRSNRLLNFSEAAPVGVDRMENLTSQSGLASVSRIRDSRQRSFLARSTEDITSRVNASSQSDQAVGQSEPVVGDERLSESYSSRVFEGVPRYTHQLDYRNRHLRHETTPSSSQASSSRSSVSFGLNQSQPWGRRSAFGSHSWGLYEGSEYRHHISAFHDRQFPRPVSDQTSQTLGAMNLPASSDQGTDVAGLNDMPVNYMQAAGVIGSPHAGPTSTAGFDQRQHLSFSNRTNLSNVPTGMCDRIHMDESSSSQAGRPVADMMETERYQSIQSFVQNVRDYLVEDSGDSSIEENMNEESSEASADGVLDGQGSRTYSIDSEAGGSRAHGRYLGNSSFLIARGRMRENNQPLESVANSSTNAWRQEPNRRHTSLFISSSSQLPGLQSGADCSPASNVFHRISTPTNSAPCSYASSQVTSSLPAASPTRSTLPAADEDSFASEPDGFQITDPLSRGILASDMGYRSLRNGANYEHPVRFHPYASVFQRGGSIFRHGDGSSLQNRYTSVMGVPSRATASASSSSSSNSILENSLSHNFATSVPLTYSGISNRLRRDSDSDQPSAFSIFDTSDRDPLRHSSTYYRSSSSLLNPTSAYSLLNPTSTNSLLNPSSTNLSHVSSPFPRGLRAHAETSSRSTSSIPRLFHPPESESEGFDLRNTEDLPGGTGDLGRRQQASTGDVSWRTPSLSLVNQAAVTEYLERRVMELDRRLSDLEQSYNSQLRQLQVECQWHRRAQTSTDHLPTRLRGVGVGPLHDPIDSVLFPRAEPSAQASSNDGAASVPFRQLLECLRRQDPNPHVRVSEADLPTSVTISQARDEVNSDEVPEASSSSGRRRPWHSLRQIHLHPDYSRSILDDTINGPSETQRAMNRNLGGAFLYSEYDMGIAGNIVVQTHRIQQWDISNVAVPDISDASANIIVRHCRLHNDASCDLSQDGTLLATIVPGYCGFADTNIVALFSLRRQTFAQCLYTKSFGPNAISVSISPLNRYILVGLASRRTIFVTSVQLVGQVFQLVKEKAGESSMKHHKDIYHAFEDDRGTTNVSVNSARWLPGVGEGLVYGTNRGDLHFFRAGSRKVHDQEFPSGQRFQSRGEYAASRQRNTARNSIATQTTTVSIRRSASTQTSTEGPDGEEINNEDDVHPNSNFES